MSWRALCTSILDLVRLRTKPWCLRPMLINDSHTTAHAWFKQTVCGQHHLCHMTLGAGSVVLLQVIATKIDKFIVVLLMMDKPLAQRMACDLYDWCIRLPQGTAAACESLLVWISPCVKSFLCKILLVWKSFLVWNCSSSSCRHRALHRS